MISSQGKQGPQSEVYSAYQQHFSDSPERLIVAPGRVNLIGEHTDYNDGFVLPCAIDFATYIAIGRPSDQELKEETLEVIALDYHGERASISLSEPIDLPRAQAPTETRWVDYVRGVIEVLRSQGRPMSSARMVISGDIPQGAGLSSSASLQVGVALACSELFNLNLTPTELALIAQQAENEYVGCQCGIMDQLASARGERGHATLIDCQDLSVNLISIPEDLGVLIVHSGVKRGLVDSEYNARRAECEEAAHTLGVKALRDVDLSTLQASRHRLSETVYRRARHVITENERTLLAAEALGRGDIEKLSALMAASHDSLRDDYEVTVAPIDLLVELIRTSLGSSGGVRMTGGGFGGCVVALSPIHRIAELKREIELKYTSLTGLTAQSFICSPSEGARALSH